jgi:thiamine biosynthesis lipoprotein
VKGWAVERAARHVADLAGYGWCLNAGGDVLVHAPDGQPPWRIGIENPNDPARIMRVVERRDGAVATSGSTHRGAHIIDPYTGRPAAAVRAVTLTGPALLWADVYATAAAARGAAALPWLHDLDGYEGMMVTSSGVLRTTNAWATC